MVVTRELALTMIFKSSFPTLVTDMFAPSRARTCVELLPWLRFGPNWGGLIFWVAVFQATLAALRTDTLVRLRSRCFHKFLQLPRHAGRPWALLNGMGWSWQQLCAPSPRHAAAGHDKHLGFRLCPSRLQISNHSGVFSIQQNIPWAKILVKLEIFPK